MNFCTGCGASLVRDTRFCTACGHSCRAEHAVTDDAVTLAAAVDTPDAALTEQLLPSTVAGQGAAEDASSGSRPRTLTVVLPVVAGLLLSGVGACAFLLQRGQTSSDTVAVASKTKQSVGSVRTSASTTQDAIGPAGGTGASGGAEETDNGAGPATPPTSTVPVADPDADGAADQSVSTRGRGEDGLGAGDPDPYDEFGRIMDRGQALRKKAIASYAVAAPKATCVSESKFEKARTEIEEVVAGRSKIVDEVAEWVTYTDRSEPELNDLVELYLKAQKLSLQQNKVIQQLVDDAQKSCSVAADRKSPEKLDWPAFDNLKTPIANAKKAFVDRWNPIADAYGYPRRDRKTL